MLFVAACSGCTLDCSRARVVNWFQPWWVLPREAREARLVRLSPSAFMIGRRAVFFQKIYIYIYLWTTDEWNRATGVPRRGWGGGTPNHFEVGTCSWCIGFFGPLRTPSHVRSVQKEPICWNPFPAVAPRSFGEVSHSQLPMLQSGDPTRRQTDHAFHPG